MWGRSFVIKTDLSSLKFLLDRCLATIPQHHWVSKLLGFDFSVQYKPGRTNIVADALSRCDTDMEINSISVPSFDLFAEFCMANEAEPALVALAARISSGELQAP